MRRAAGILVALALMLGGVRQAEAGYLTLDPSGSIHTVAVGVSGNNVVGFYETQVGGNNHGFLYNGSTYTPLDAPGSTNTVAVGVSGNNVAGYYQAGGTYHVIPGRPSKCES